MDKIRVTIFANNKKSGKPTTMLTAYDYATASVLEKAGVDTILVGDSLGMVFQGNSDTLSVTVDEMIYHTKAVRKGAPTPFLITDMPFLSYHVSCEDTVRNAGKIIKESGAEAVKIEGGKEIAPMIEALVKAKIPVIAHIGLTPQSVNQFGGFTVQGRTIEAAHRLIEDAILLEELGVHAIVLECIPEKIAQMITSKINISTIGIGSGRFVDGQVLVINDITGLYDSIKPKFVKQYANLSQMMEAAVKQYIDEVQSKVFPDETHIFKIDTNTLKILSEE